MVMLPSRVNLAAFDTRLSITWRVRNSSPYARGRPGAISARIWIGLSFTRPMPIERTASTTFFISKCASCRSILPAVILA